MDQLMFRRYVKDVYTCIHFADEVWKLVASEDLIKRLNGFANVKGLATPKKRHFRSFIKHDEPVNPCLVLMTQLGMDPHVGVYSDGQVIHLGRNGPECMSMDLACRDFTEIGFYS